MDDIELIREGERLDDLQRGGLRIIQRKEGFRFGTDAVLLADFCSAKKGERVCDMGTGTGVLPLLISARAENTTFDAFEIQPDVADMASRSVRINGLQGRIRIHCADCREAAKTIGHEVCDLVVTNPPYTAAGAGLISPERTRALSRSDADCSLEEWIAASARVLRNGGRLCCVFPAPRFLQLCDAMRAARVEPKRVRFVAARAEFAPKLVLTEGLKGGRPGLHIAPLLITHTQAAVLRRRCAGFTANWTRSERKPRAVCAVAGDGQQEGQQTGNKADHRTRAQVHQ